MTKKKMYISGKMKGLDNYKTLFSEAEKEFQTNYRVMNPCRFEHTSDAWEDRILHDLNIIKSCDVVYMLNNWKDSNGAQTEHYFAQGMGKEIIYQE